MGRLYESNKAGPCNIVSCGDSIMWGQGLDNNFKFTHILSKMVSDESGVKTNLLHLAHSGATIDTPSPKKDIWEIYTEVPAPDDSPYDGEIPRASPTVLEQIDLIGEHLYHNDVDILLLDGGANDLSFSSFIFGKDLMGHRGYIREVAIDKVKKLLSKAKAQCQNAKIIYLAPFAPVSHETNWPNVTDRDAGLSLILWATGELERDGPFSSSFTSKPSTEFPYGLSVFINYSMQAVAEFNEEYCHDDPVLYVHPRFHKNNAVYASDPFVGSWGTLECPNVFKGRLAKLRDVYEKNTEEFRNEKKVSLPGFSFTDGLEMVEVRSFEFLDRWRIEQGLNPKHKWMPNPLSELDMDITTLRHTHFIHPNKEGAKQYANCIIEAEPSMRKTVGVLRGNTSFRKIVEDTGLPLANLRTLSSHAKCLYLSLEFKDSIYDSLYKKSLGSILGFGEEEMSDEDKIYMSNDLLVENVFQLYSEFTSGNKSARVYNVIETNRVDSGYIDFPFEESHTSINVLDGMKIMHLGSNEIPEISSLSIYLNGKRFLFLEGERFWNVKTGRGRFTKTLTVDFKKHRNYICYE